ncbi:MAG: hypothetical protein KatS3mg117_2365 [Geminicoccaceae bacterium]|jgi:hypothetical protein|nr:MAG: hypothetical protein KatS3mg117_2365 [Geminicoccaceae bacterium]
MRVSQPFLRAVSVALLAALTLGSACAADPAPIETIGDDAAAAAFAKNARLLVTTGPNADLRVAVRGGTVGPAEPPLKADDPAVRAVLQMLGLDRPSRFALVGAQNPQCVKICELIGGDYVCRRVCS